MPRLPGADWRQLMTRILMVVLLILGAGIAAQADQRGSERTTPAAKASSSGPLNLNTATVAQLEALPGIGKSVAERILQYREKSGGFKKVEDLMNVRGIGEKSFLKLKPLITVTSGKSGSAEQ
jgi:competence protein ComEA